MSIDTQLPRMNVRRDIFIGLLFAAVAIAALGALAYFAPNLDQSKERAEVQTFVSDFGERLQNVPLSGSEGDAQRAIQEVYPQFVTTELLQQWVTNPRLAPGRLTSSPWPERIDVLQILPQGSGYIVRGNIILYTSAEEARGEGNAGTIPVLIQVIRDGGTWRIGVYQEQAFEN